MGEAADDVINSMLWGGSWSGKSRGGFQRGAGKGMWRSASGLVEISSMSDAHLQNALIVCGRTNNTAKAKDIRAEISRRKEP